MGIELSNIKTIYKAIMIRVVWYLQRNRKEIPEIKL